ncbi:MAG: hypothetical protein PVF83_13620 [Anaerolineales bacterium]|jgi:hypothetical protein
MTCRTESSQVWVHEYNAENRISTTPPTPSPCKDKIIYAKPYPQGEMFVNCPYKYQYL